MKQIALHRITGLLILISIAILLGAGNQPLIEIETAILDRDYALAESLAQDLMSQNDQQERLMQSQYYLGVSRLYLQKFVQARETFQALLASGPDQSFQDKAWLGIIDSYYMAGDYQEAFRKINSLLKKRPDSKFLSLIYLKLARTNLRLTRWDEAEKYLKKIINEFPQSLEFYTAKQLLEERQFFAVQVGSFLDHTRAEHLTYELQQKGEYAYIVETVDQSGRKFFRVRVGQFSGLDEAQQLKRKLSRAGYPALIYP